MKQVLIFHWHHQKKNRGATNHSSPWRVKGIPQPSQTALTIPVHTLRHWNKKEEGEGEWWSSEAI